MNKKKILIFLLILISSTAYLFRNLDSKSKIKLRMSKENVMFYSGREGEREDDSSTSLHPSSMAPLHKVPLKEDNPLFIDKENHSSSYIPEEEGVKEKFKGLSSSTLTAVSNKVTISNRKEQSPALGERDTHKQAVPDSSKSKLEELSDISPEGLVSTPDNRILNKLSEGFTTVYSQLKAKNSESVSERNAEKTTSELMEVTYTKLTTNDKIYNGFYPLYHNSEGYWIAMEEYLDYLGAKDVVIERGRRIRGTYNFKPINVRLDILSDGLLIEEKTYIRLDVLDQLPIIRRVIHQEENLDLKIYLDFKLIQETKKEEEYKRSSISEYSEEVVYEEEWKVFTPGQMNLRYRNNSLSDSNSSLNLNYSNHLLYGNMNIDYSVNRMNGSTDNEINRITWKRNIFDNKRMVVGDVYQSSGATNLTGESMRGLTLSRSGSWDYSTRVTRSSISGYTASGTTVELYRNNVLVDYTTVESGQYEFNVERRSTDRFYLRFYYPDGRREELQVSAINNYMLVDAGKFDYEGQIGDADDKEGTLYSSGIYYGLNERTTLGLNSFNSRDELDNLREFYNVSLINQGELIYKPYSMEVSYLEGGKGNNSYYVDYTHDISNRFRYNIYYEDSSSMDNYYTKYDKNLEMSIGGSLWGYSYSVLYDRETENNMEDERYELSLSRSFGQVYINTDYIEHDDYSEYKLGSTYYARGKYSSVFDSIGVDISKYSKKKNSVSYSSYVSRNSSATGGLTYYLRYSGGDNTDNLFSFEMAYRFGDKFELGTMGNSKSSDNTGMFINTGINFAKKSKIDYPYTSGDSTIKGRVFVDSNNDGIYQEGEEVLEGVKITSNGGEIATSDSNGEYLLTGVTPKALRKLRIEAGELDIYYSVPDDPKLRTLPGGLANLDIPIINMQTLSGAVTFSDQFYYEEVVEVLANSKIVARNLKTNQKFDVTLRDENYVLDLPSGDYEVTMVYEGGQSIVIKNNGDYFVDLKGSFDYHNAFTITVSKHEIENMEVYVLNIEGRDNFYSDKVYRTADLIREKEVSFKKEKQ